MTLATDVCRTTLSQHPELSPLMAAANMCLASSRPLTPPHRDQTPKGQVVSVRLTDKTQ